MTLLEILQPTKPQPAQNARVVSPLGPLSRLDIEARRGADRSQYWAEYHKRRVSLDASYVERRRAAARVAMRRLRGEKK
jgi:hypothetical protein